MSDSRISRLSQLLESRNRVLRNEAAAQLAQFPLSNSTVRDTIRKQLQSPQWDTRAAAAHAFGLLLERMTRETKSNLKLTDYVDYEPELLVDLDLSDVITHYKVLLSCEERAIATKPKLAEKRLSSREQRRLVDQHLDLTVHAGVSSQSFLGDDDLGVDLNGSADDQSNGLDELKEQLVTRLHSDTSKATKIEAPAEEFDSPARVYLIEFVGQLLVDLAAVNWQQRHGNSMALSQVVTHALSLLPFRLVESLAIRTLQVLALDQFNDFVTGSNAVAPVRESAAQTLSMLMLRLGAQTPLVRSVIGHLQVLMLMDEEKNWPCRQTSLIVLKYYFAACTATDEFAALFDYAVEAMKDLVDEVVSVAVHAVSSLFGNERISAEKKHELIQVVMKSVWEMLLSTDAEAQQLTDGVSSLLIDLLGIVKTWLSVDKTAHLSTAQFRHVVDLFDPSQFSSTLRAMECACLALNGNSELEDDEIFLLLKMLYRCVLFVPPSDSSKLLDLAFTTVMKVVDAYSEVRLGSIQQLQTTIGYWAGCLTYDHKNSEFDVFTHNVNGPTSSRSQPLEILCGDEARFLEDRQKQSTFMERKCWAARFLSLLIDVLYRSEVKIQDQPFNLSLQLHFAPYLQTNLLHQRLGVCLLLNCWARQFRRAFNANKPQEYPTLVVREVERILVVASSASRPPYDEVATMINVLTSECNEFRRYCLDNGVPTSECPPVEGATGGMEELVGKLHAACRSRLRKAADLEALDGRRDYLLQLIAATRLEIRTNTNRLHALCASALFYWSHYPPQLTPMIRPLVDATDTEDLELLAEECFYDSFPIMLAATRDRQPCPHAKIVRQLALGIQQDEKFTPRPATYASESSTAASPMILTTQNALLQPSETRTRNCQLIVSKLGEQLCRLLFEFCPQLSSYLRLDGHELQKAEGMESFLCNVEFVRLLAAPTGHRPLVETEIPVLVAQLANPNPAVRFRVSRCLSELAAADFSFVLNSCYASLVQLLDRIDSPAARCGAIEALALLTVRLDAPRLIAAASLLAPRALAALSDPLAAVRELAAAAFGRLVGLMHLESDHERVFPDLNDELTAALGASRHFVNVLSAPHLLPTVSPSTIPGLRSDFQLRHYQLEGITWLRFLATYGLNGILADDMGLGKTIQTLSLLATERLNQPKLSSLIVCPRTLSNHWTNEWLRYFPDQRPFVKFESTLKVADRLANTNDVLVLSYEELRANIKQINSLPWNYVVLDEGHCIRNPNTQLFEALESLITKRKLLLSGTPVQNSPADLWALFRFLMPDYLSSRSTFQSRFLRPILACRNPKASEQQTKEGEEALGQLHRLVLPFVLRRLKSDVLKELPDKVVQDRQCALTELQRTLYATIVARCSLAKAEDERNGDQKPKAEVKSEVGAQTQQLSPLHTLIALRQLVDHPLLIREVLAKIGWSNTRIFDPYGKTATQMHHSGKLLALKELLEECQIGDQQSANDSALSDPQPSTSTAESLDSMPNLSSQHRALIFCQWRSSVELVARYLDDESLGPGIRYLRLDGTVPPDDRQSIVDRFNNDPSIHLLLLTTHIGGVGLTLTGADVVIFLDHDWNPTKDLQAVDRAHRLGQTRTVNVYRLITQDTIEEKIMHFQKFKTDTANALVGADNRSISSMATDELLNLFNLNPDSSAVSSDRNGEPPTQKRRRKAAAEGGDQWSMEELWDESQYENEHSVRAFMDRT